MRHRLRGTLEALESVLGKGAPKKANIKSPRDGRRVSRTPANRWILEYAARSFRMNESNWKVPPALPKFQ
jgi:hypothetical protein